MLISFPFCKLAFKHSLNPNISPKSIYILFENFSCFELLSIPGYFFAQIKHFFVFSPDRLSVILLYDLNFKILLILTNTYLT